MKIALSLLTLNLDMLGGLNIKAVELIRGLVRRGNTVSIFQTPLSARNSTRFINSLNGHVKSITLNNIKIPRGYLYWLYLPFLWLNASKYIMKEKADIYDLWDPLIGIDGTVGHGHKTIFNHIFFTPYIYMHFRNCGWRSLPMFFEIPFIEKMIHLYGKKIDGYIVENYLDKDLLLDTYQLTESAIALIPPGYDQKIIDQYRIPADRINTNGRNSLVYSGRIHRWKGVNELINAFNLIAKEFPKWDLQLIGNGPELEKIKQTVIRLDLGNRVIFWGEQSHSDTIKLVSSGDIFVFPSYIEGFSLSALEALALGMPIITTEIVGQKSGLIKDGYSGLIVPSKNIDLLYSSIKKLILNPELRSLISKNGQNLAGEFTFENMVEKMISFYKQ